MKSILKKTQFIFLLFASVILFAQQKMKLPGNAVFYMEINGKQLNKKINWQKLNPFLRDVTKESKEKPSWTDYSKTGIKYDATQYHYAVFNDSVKTYSAHFILDNKEKFQEFINSAKKKGLEISKKNNYSYVNLDDDIFIAWNGNRAVLKMIGYTKPYKYDWDDEAVTDTAAIAVDSVAAIAMDSAYVEEPELPFNYKDEVEILKDDIKYLKEDIKEYNAEIARKQKDIKYLEKHHEYPKEIKGATDKNYTDKEKEILPPPIDEEEDMEDEEESIDDLAYQKELDSLNIEKFKIVKKLAEEDFDQYFSSNFEIEVPKDVLSFRDVNSDVFVYSDYGKIINDGIYGRMMKRYEFGEFFNKFYNSNSSYNLYFDNDKVRLVNSYQHKDPEVQKYFSSIYKGKKNKKLMSLINDKSMGYYAMNLDGSKYFDLMYSLFKNSDEGGEYQKEMDLMLETIKIVLDEEAISKIAPGSGIFVLNELKSKMVEYTDYDYDDDYNEKEVKKTKEVMMPNFTFAFATENEGYWNRIFNVLISNKKTAKNFSKNGDFYEFKEEKETGYLDHLFFTVKDGVVYITTSPENITPQNQSEISKKWAKDSSKYAMSGRLNIQKILIGLEKEFKSISERKIMDVFKKNVGEVHFKTEAKGDRIETEMNYDIKNSSENSLMYSFDLVNEIYKIKESEKKTPIL